MQRRHFVQTLGAGSAMAGLGALTGCASTGGSGPKVVVVGGGYAGATAAKYLRLFSDNTVNVTLVEPNANFVSCPISNLVINGASLFRAVFSMGGGGSACLRAELLFAMMGIGGIWGMGRGTAPN